MNPQAKKIKAINKFIPTGNSNINNNTNKNQIKSPSLNIPLGTPIQSKRPFNKDREKSPSNLNSNQVNFSARGMKNLNLKNSSSNFGRGLNNNNSKSSYFDANNSLRMNSAGKKIEFQRKSIDTTNNKTNSSLNNLYGVIKGK
jgi:hypothetical protein